MRYLELFAGCLVALAVQSTAWAQIYETTDAQGNPVFTDSPPSSGAEAIDLQQTNIIDAPTPEPQEVSAPESVVEQEAPVQENRTVIINDANNDEEDVYDADRRRERAFEERDPAAPQEVGDYDSQMPREVGDSDSQMPREVGDSDSQMPYEVGDSDSQMPREVGDAEPRSPNAEGDYDIEARPEHHRR
jgi:hypothetical protein